MKPIDFPYSKIQEICLRWAKASGYDTVDNIKLYCDKLIFSANYYTPGCPISFSIDVKYLYDDSTLEKDAQEIKKIKKNKENEFKEQLKRRREIEESALFQEYKSILYKLGYKVDITTNYNFYL